MNRAYGGALSGGAVRDRFVFLNFNTNLVLIWGSCYFSLIMNLAILTYLMLPTII